MILLVIYNFSHIYTHRTKLVQLSIHCTVADYESLHLSEQKLVLDKLTRVGHPIEPETSSFRGINFQDIFNYS